MLPQHTPSLKTAWVVSIPTHQFIRRYSNIGYLNIALGNPLVNTSPKINQQHQIDRQRQYDIDGWQQENKTQDDHLPWLAYLHWNRKIELWTFWTFRTVPFGLSGRFELSGPCQHIVNQSDPGPVSLGEMEASNATLSPPDTKESSESIWLQYHSKSSFWPEDRVLSPSERKYSPSGTDHSPSETEDSPSETEDSPSNTEVRLSIKHGVLYWMRLLIGLRMFRFVAKFTLIHVIV
jgi:hypothetical protein